MQLIFTPRQFSQRADFYYQLGQLTGAGLGLVRALEQLQRSPPSASYRAPIARLLRELGGGFTFGESLQRVGPWLPALDQALLRAGEQSGRLDACLRMLANYYQDRARMARELLSGLAYPAFLFHFAVFSLPFPRLFSDWSISRYLLHTLGPLCVLYLLIGAGIYMLQGRHGEAWRARVERLLNPVPLLGRARQALALARLAAGLEALLGAGVTIVEAWELAATASGSPALRSAVLAWRPALEAGQTPSEAVSSSRLFPSLFASQYATGEISGTLEDTLRRLHAYYEEEGSRKLHLLAQWTPRVVYLLVAAVIAFKIVQFWTAQFNFEGLDEQLWK